MPTLMSEGRPRHILIGVTGGIAAYKACSVIRQFTEAGDDVTVVPTHSALNFVGAATLEALSGHTVSTEVFSGIPEVQHVRLGQEADLLLVVPATADFLARVVAGRADDLLTASILVARCPIVLAPAMHTEMWNNPATQDNVRVLRSRGITVIEPAVGRLTGADSGVGRLPDSEEIVTLAHLAMSEGKSLPQDLTGLSCVISAGGTHEPIDPVRFIGNRSSGKQGVALARIAAQRGANVTLVLGQHRDISLPSGITIINVTTAQNMYEVMKKEAQHADIIIMAAAVADFRPAHEALWKLKKGHASEPESIPLVRNTDILAELVESRSKGEINDETTIVGFAAETGDAEASALDYGQQKLLRKNCDLLIVNQVGPQQAFGTEDNSGWILGRHGLTHELPMTSKTIMASHIIDAIMKYRSSMDVS